MLPDDHIVVTGMGCVTAGGGNLPLTLVSVDAGRQNNSVSPFTEVVPASPVFCCPDVALPETENFSRTVRLACVAAKEALADAGWSGGFASAVRVGVCVGASVGASLHFTEYYRAWLKKEAYPLDSIHQYLNSNPALALAKLLHAHGLAMTVTNACSSGADAIGLAYSWLRQNLCDVVIAGGADELCEISYTGFSRLTITSSEPCMPFDARRTGLNLGEGAGIMILERESAARKRGARSYGRIIGYGTATDSHHLTAPHPDGTGLFSAYAQVFRQSGLNADNIAFINAHGTATKTNDRVEGLFFKKYFSKTPFVSTKGITGHTLGAAGAIEAIFTVAHLMRGYLPACPGFRVPDAEIGVVPVTVPVKINGNIAASQSLAFGGNNSVLLFARGDN
jgi:3-oxoacyl-[acyl-carrier-protein] synthase-1/3-oxoacyl-[acyl-carrier-protein] synthase II